MSLLITVALAALAMDTPRPAPAWAGPAFVCRMTHEEGGGGGFILTGNFGTGQRFDSGDADLRRSWVYTFPDARIQDCEILFSGAAMEARTGTFDAPAALAGAALSIAYPRTGGGMELVIEGASGGNRQARLQGYRHGERVARGNCTLTPSGAAQDRAEARS